MVLASAKVREEKELFNNVYIPTVYSRHSVFPLSKLQYYSVISLAILKARDDPVISPTAY